MLNVHQNDSNIIKRDELIIDVSKLMSDNQPVTINLNEEGPCAASLGLYTLLDQLVEKFNYNKSNVTISTCNLIEQHTEYNIVKRPQMMYLNSARDFDRTNNFVAKEFNNDFAHFGHFIGHGNLHRLHIASQLYTKYKEKTLQSYHYTRHSDYHRMFIGLEDLIYGNYPDGDINAALLLLNDSPLTIDNIDTYPILNPATLNITKVYHKFFVEVVNLTYFSGNTFYIDEKVWRPILMRTPFIIQGPQNYILNLHKLGFKTFSQYWDEGYSEDPADCQSRAILDNVGHLAKLSVADVESMYNSMNPILEHNYQRLYELTHDDFLSFNKYC